MSNIFIAKEGSGSVTLLVISSVANVILKSPVEYIIRRNNLSNAGQISVQSYRVQSNAYIKCTVDRGPVSRINRR